MLRLARFPFGCRGLLTLRPVLPAATTTTTTTATTITSTRPITLSSGSGRGGTTSRSFFRPPSTWSPSTIATIAAGIMLVGTWYIVEEGRSYRVGDEVDKYEPRVLGTHRPGEKVNPDYVRYEVWVERHRRAGKS
ncbi:hypothetical protein VTK56DRAFT_2001 [Thermocarpiscus australiensis]